MKMHKIIVAFTVQIRNQKFCRCSIQKVVLVADKILKFTWNEYSGKYFLVLQGFMVLGFMVQIVQTDRRFSILPDFKFPQTYMCYISLDCKLFGDHKFGLIMPKN